MAELHRLSTKEYLHTPKLPVTVILDNIRSCHNTGSVFRTADALMIEKIWLCGITATPPDKEIHKTALDAEKVVAWGGSVSAEHGIGLVKKPYLGCTRSEAEIAVLRGIKTVLDPAGIMNPGKLFDP